MHADSPAPDRIGSLLNTTERTKSGDKGLTMVIHICERLPCNSSRVP